MKTKIPTTTMDSNTVIFSASLRKCPIPKGKIHTCVWIFPLQSVLILVVGIFDLKVALQETAGLTS